MGLRVIGAGVGRTGTNSLKVALERLLNGPCYHMIEVFGHPEHVPLWKGAFEGQDPDWDALFDGYVAAVDWPPGGVWQPIADHYPDAIVLLSERDSPEAWWKSAEQTIFAALDRDTPPEMAGWRDMAEAMLTSFDPRWSEAGPAMAAYERHNANVRATVPAERLVEWKPGDGWEPLCSALGVPVPDETFPHTNTTEEFRARSGLDEPA
jgi:hypothetical protein